MISERVIAVDDLELVSGLMKNDPYHKHIDPEFMYQEGGITNVYSDEKGPVLFVRASKTLRLFVQFSEDKERNGKALIETLPLMVEKAKASGYTELIFSTTNPALSRFCCKHLGFTQSDNEMRKVI
jgi:hypothetical protein